MKASENLRINLYFLPDDPEQVAAYEFIKNIPRNSKGRFISTLVSKFAKEYLPMELSEMTKEQVLGAVLLYASSTTKTSVEVVHSEQSNKVPVSAKRVKNSNTSNSETDVVKSKRQVGKATSAVNVPVYEEDGLNDETAFNEETENSMSDEEMFELLDGLSAF